MRFFKKSFVFFPFCFFILISSIQAQDFFLKEDESSIGRITLDLVFNEKNELTFAHPEVLKQFLMNDKEIPTASIAPRPPTGIENAVSAGLTAFTALLMMMVQDIYQINSEVRLSTTRGVLFFIFPFESHRLFIDCGNEHHLVATSLQPDSDTLKSMKSLSEVRKLCGVKDDQS